MYRNELVPRLGLVELSAAKELDEPHAEELLLDALGVAGSTSRAIEAFGRLQSKRAVKPIIAILKGHDRFTVTVAAQVLGEIQDPRSLQPLCGLLRSRDEGVRRSAAEGLGLLGDARAISPLTAALKDADQGVRWNAANALGRIKNPAAVDVLVGVLNDSEEGVRAAALDALGDIGELNSTKGRTRWHAASALAMFDAPEVDDALTKALQHGELDVVAAAYKYFLPKNDPESVAALVAAMKKHGWPEMADGLRGSGNSQLVEAASEWDARNELQLQK